MKSFAIWILGGLGLFAGLAGLASYWLTATWAGGWLFLLVGAFAAAAWIFGGLLGFFVELFVLLLWLMLWLTPNWAVEWIFPLADAAVLVAAALLYRSMLPEAWEFVTKRPDAASIENIGGGPTFLPLPFMSPRVCARIIPLLPSMMRLTTLDAIFHREPLGGLAKQLRLYLGAVELTRGQPMIFFECRTCPAGNHWGKRPMGTKMVS